MIFYYHNFKTIYMTIELEYWTYRKMYDQVFINHL